jgi:magnesium transporter
MATSYENLTKHGLNIELITWGNLTWINIVSPTEKEIEYLADHYRFHPMDLEDCLSRRQQPKLDVYEDYLFFIFHFSIWDKKTRVSKPDQVSVFIGDKYLITVHNGLLKTLVSLFHQCQTSEEICQENLDNGSGYLLYRILDRTTDTYFPILNSILAWVEDVEDAVFDENIETAMEVATLRRDIITQRRIFHSVRPVYAVLESKIKKFCKIDIAVQFGDLVDHVNKICDALDEAKDIVEIFKDSDYVLSTERLNRIMRVLTIISTIMLPLIVLSGLWSMNVPLPLGGDPGGSHFFFYGMVAMLLFVSLIMLYIFHRRHWI